MKNGVARFFSGLINIFVFDILQIPIGCIRPLALLFATDLLVLMTSPQRVARLHGKVKVNTASVGYAYSLVQE
jgi:hypothetical protein